MAWHHPGLEPQSLAQAYDESASLSITQQAVLALGNVFMWAASVPEFV